MKTIKLLYLVIGMLLGTILGGMTCLNGASHSKAGYDAAVRGIIELLDEDHVLDVLCETDEWAELNEYVDLSAE